MEELKQIQWSWNKFNSKEDDFFDASFSDNEADIFLCHLDEIDPIHLLDRNGHNDINEYLTHKYIDPRTGHEVNNLFVNYQKINGISLYSNFPIKSMIRSGNHAPCIRALEKLKNLGEHLTEQNRNDLKIYGSLTETLKSENKLFQDFVKSHFLMQSTKQKCSVDSELNQFVILKWKHRLDKCLAEKHSSFKIQTALPLKSTQNVDVSLKVGDIYKQQGTVYRYSPHLYRPHLRKSCEFIREFKPKKSEISKEEIELLALEQNVDFIMPSSVLFLLIDPENVSKDWSILFDIDEIDCNKVIHFRKPLPPISMNDKQRNQMAYKACIKASCIANTQICYSLKNKTFTPITSTSNLPILQTSNQHNKSTFKVYKFEEYLQKIERKFGIEKSNEFQGNCGYCLWELSNGPEIENTIRLLIKTKIDCYDELNGEQIWVNLSPKIEYQPEFGAEQMTCSELIREWCQQKLLPASTTERVRISAETGVSLSHKRISIQQIEHDLYRLHSIDSKTILQNLYGILKIIRNFPKSNFMLRHTSDRKETVMVLGKCDSKCDNSFSIENVYANINFDQSPLDKVNWTPIDNMEVTQLHHQSNIIPCTFPHWGNKRRTLINDRAAIIKKAEFVQNKKLELKKEKNVKQKMRKEMKRKRIREQKKNQLLKRNMNLMHTKAGESFDPMEMFDADGNVHIADFSEKSTENNEQKELNQNTDSYLYDYSNYGNELFLTPIKGEMVKEKIETSEALDGTQDKLLDADHSVCNSLDSSIELNSENCDKVSESNTQALVKRTLRSSTKKPINLSQDYATRSTLKRKTKDGNTINISPIKKSNERKKRKTS